MPTSCGSPDSRRLHIYERMLAVYMPIHEDNARGKRGHSIDAWLLTVDELTTWCAISFGVSSPGWWGDRLVAACYQAAARPDTSEPMARTVSGRSSRRPIQRCSGRQCLDPAMACCTQIRCEDWVWRACSQAWTTSGGASLAGFFGGTLTWAGWSRRRPR